MDIIYLFVDCLTMLFHLLKLSTVEWEQAQSQEM
jgi:hypothetical protein